MKHTEPVAERSTWTANELTTDPSWRYALTNDEIDELDHATRFVQAKGLAVGEFSADDFPLPTLADRIESFADEVENGRGLAVVSGIPVERYDENAIRLLYWGFGVHAAIPISQNSKGQLMAEVSDRGNNYQDINTRGFATNAELRPHVDTSDMTTLLCIRAARSGGESRVVSSSSVFNTILREHPEHLEYLFRGYYNDLRGEGPTGDINEVTTHRVPVFSHFAGRVSCSFNYRMIDGATKKTGIPLTPEERAAIDCVREVADRDELNHRFSLKPGDIQMISNHSVFHSRTTFVDHDDPNKRRCLLRFWMNIRNGRPLEEHFAARYNTGPRGGVAVGTGAKYEF